VDADNDLREAMKNPDDAWISRNRRVIEQALEEIADHLGVLIIDTGGRPAELWLDGAFLAALPHGATKIAAGAHRLELRADGRSPVQRSLDIPAKATLIVEFSLDAERSPAAISPAPPPARAPSKPASKSTARVAAWSAVAVGGVFLAEGLIAQFMRESLLAKYNDDALCGPTATESRSQRCGNYLHDAGTAQTLAIVGFVAAGASALTSASLFVFAPPSSRSNTSSFLGPPAVGVGYRTQF
jgi:hypothetical protein